MRNGLAPQTRQFAEDLQILLGRTVCDFVKIDGRILPGGTQAIVGTNLSDFTSRPIRLRSSAETPVWIDVSAYLMLDPDEGLADPKADWRDVLDGSRREYRLKQIRAAVRRHPGTAIRELERLGYAVAHPRDSRSRALILRLVGRVPTQRGVGTGKTAPERG
ncbi:hypothetical protein [Actinoplanes sp. NPDC051851]|uniref:hypothetical protein n=1 Tax=Actinoplanes sp. NPDC051851 TaxID=3154753 RepID=UPI003441127C